MSDNAEKYQSVFPKAEDNILKCQDILFTVTEE